MCVDADARFADPVFGVATGIAAYIIWERDPRNAHDHGPGNTLGDLVARRLGLRSSASAPASARAAQAAPSTPAASLKSPTAPAPTPVEHEAPRRVI